MIRLAATGVGGLDSVEPAPNMEFRTYRVRSRDRAPLLSFILDGLESSGCQIIHRPSPETTPFRITYQAPTGERAGVVAYDFLANTKPTKNRPADEHRFQVKYGKKAGAASALARSVRVYTTPLRGINQTRLLRRRIRCSTTLRKPSPSSSRTAVAQRSGLG